MVNTALAALTLDSLATVTGGQTETRQPASETMSVEDLSRKFDGFTGMRRWHRGAELTCTPQGCKLKAD